MFNRFPSRILKTRSARTLSPVIIFQTGAIFGKDRESEKNNVCIQTKIKRKYPGYLKSVRTFSHHTLHGGFLMEQKGTIHPLTSPFRSTLIAFSVLSLATFSATPALAASSAYRIADSDPAGSYRIDPDHSSVTFTIGHAGVATAVGRFDKIGGHYRLSSRKPSETDAVIEIATNSIDTNHPMRDKDLRGPDFLDANTFPTIRFVATHYKKTGNKSGLLTGKLTLHGKTRPVSFKIHEVGAGDVSALPKPWGGYLSGYDAEATLRRSDFGIRTYPSMIGDRIHLYISIEGIRTKK